MNEAITFALVCFTSFFTLINPVGVMPVYMTMTANLSEKQKNATARKAMLVSFATLMLFAFSGQLLFSFFGISVNSLRVVGGLIFFFMGQDMLNARLVSTKISEADVKQYVNDISVTPLAIPMIVGPGAITSAIVLMEDANTMYKKGAFVLSVVAILGITYVVLLGASRISKALGETGNNILMRLMGLIVMVIAVEFFFSGLRPILQDIFNIAK